MVKLSSMSPFAERFFFSFLYLQEEFGKSLVENFPGDFVVDLSPTVDGYAYQ